MVYRLSENLLKHRTKMKLTQQNIADIFNFNRATYTYYETGKTCPSLETLVRLARLFDTTVDELLGVDDSTSSVALNEEASISLRKVDISEAPTTYLSVMRKLLDLNPDELRAINQEVDKILDSHKD